MIEIHKYPRCEKYLRAANVNLNDASMNEYWAALCIAESFTDASLLKFGGVDFHRMPGSKLLARMEEFLEYRSKANPKPSRSVKKFVPSNPLDRITNPVSDDEITAAMTTKGAWKREKLEEWGVSWPPPRGWKRKLIDNFKASSQ